VSVEGPWICRACWKTNRPGDDRCYRCHLTRDADEATVQRKRGAGKAGAAKDDARNALDVLKALPNASVSIFTILQGLVFWVTGVSALVFGVMFLGALLLVSFSDRMQFQVWLLWAAAAGIAIGSGLFWLRASRAIRAREPWALGISLVSSLTSAVAGVVLLRTRPAAAVQLDPWLYGEIAIFGTAALLATLGLLLSHGEP